MSKIIGLLILFIYTSIFSQQKINTNPWVKFSRDTIVNTKLQNAITHFLYEANQGNFKTKYINSEHYKNNTYFFEQFENIFKSHYFKDSIFYKPYLIQSYSINKKDYYITLQFSGIDNDKKVITHKIIQFLAKFNADNYQIYCLFDENTKYWKRKTKKGVTFHYSNTFDKKKALRFVNFNKKLEQLTKHKSPILNYYKCKNPQEALAIFGIKYSIRYANASSGFGMSDDYGNFITGIDSEDYLHDHIHSFFSKIYNRKETWREFEEGIAIYYGGNWGVSLATLKNKLREELISSPNFDFLTEFKKGRKGKRYDKLHIFDRVINAVFVEKIIKTHGFDAAVKVMHCGNNGEKFFTLLHQKTGINESNFNSKLKELLNSN